MKYMLLCMWMNACSESTLYVRCDEQTRKKSKRENFDVQVVKICLISNLYKIYGVGVIMMFSHRIRLRVWNSHTNFVYINFFKYMPIGRKKWCFCKFIESKNNFFPLHCILRLFVVDEHNLRVFNFSVPMDTHLLHFWLR